MNSILIRVRLKGTDRFVGKKDISYRLYPDGMDKEPNPKMFVLEHAAKVWTDKKTLKGVLSLSAKMHQYCFPKEAKTQKLTWESDNWSRYEIVFPNGETKSILDFLMEE